VKLWPVGSLVIFAEPVNGPPSVGKVVRHGRDDGGDYTEISHHGERLKVDRSQLRAIDCKACEHRARTGFDGQCPACANERTVAQRNRGAEDELDAETRRALDEVIHHSVGRTGKVARAIEAGLVALGEGSRLTGLHRQSLEEWVSMVSECGGVGDRWTSWRDAVATLLRTIDAKCPAATPGPLEQLLTSLTPQQAEQLARPLSEQQRDLLQQVLLLRRSRGDV